MRKKCYRRLRNNYACLQALVNNALTWQSSCVIANNARKTQKLFVQGYNLKVYDVLKYTRKHRATVTVLIISRANQGQKSLQVIVTFGEIRTLLKEYR